MNSRISSVLALAMIAPSFLSSAHAFCPDIYPALNFGERLCANTFYQAPHSSLIELKGNRTSCVLSAADKVTYHVCSARVQPLSQSAFEIANVGNFVLALTSDCGMDPCYTVEQSPQEQLKGASVYTSPGIVKDRLAYIAVYDCKDGQMLSNMVEIYEATPEIVLSLQFVHGIQTTLTEIRDCVEAAAKTAAAQMEPASIGVVSLSLESASGNENQKDAQIVAVSATA